MFFALENSISVMLFTRALETGMHFSITRNASTSGLVFFLNYFPDFFFFLQDSVYNVLQ